MDCQLQNKYKKRPQNGPKKFIGATLSHFTDREGIYQSSFSFYTKAYSDMVFNQGMCLWNNRFFLFSALRKILLAHTLRLEFMIQISLQQIARNMLTTNFLGLMNSFLINSILSMPDCLVVCTVCNLVNCFFMLWAKKNCISFSLGGIE